MMMEKFSISDVIYEVIDIHKEEINRKNLSIKLEIKEERIYADKLSIHEVLDNLLSNSIKYTPEGGTISIRTLQYNSEKLTIEFSDTGIGIPKKEVSNIFDEFYIASNIKRAGTDNSGMGLAIVRKIIKSHRGTIYVKSEEGIGTTFTIRLPGVNKGKPNK
jgi:two-component system phosphate regulon sensor histidine kinase PhoR